MLVENLISSFFVTIFVDKIVDRFKEVVSDIGGIVWNGLPNATDLWQPVDTEYAKAIKI